LLEAFMIVDVLTTAIVPIWETYEL